MELATIWMGRGRGSLLTMDDVNKMIEEGWKLVQWQPVVVPPLVSSGRLTRLPIPEQRTYDAFLLRKD